MNKKMKIPAAIAAMASLATSFPVFAMGARKDAITGTEVSQGVNMLFYDGKDFTPLEGVKVEIFDVSALTSSAEGTYDLTGLTPVKTYTTQEANEDDMYTVLGLSAGKYVARLTPPDGYVINNYMGVPQNATNEVIFEIAELDADTTEYFAEFALSFIDSSIAGTDTLSLQVCDDDMNPIPNAKFKVTRTGLDGTVYDLGEYVSDANGVVSCPADATDDMPAGSQYTFTIIDIPDGYVCSSSNSVTLQAVEDLNEGYFYLSAADRIGTCKITVYDFMTYEPIANCPIMLTGSDGIAHNFTTNGNGEVIVSGLADGLYDVSYGGDDANITFSDAVAVIYSDMVTSLSFYIQNTSVGKLSMAATTLPIGESFEVCVINVQTGAIYGPYTINGGQITDSDDLPFGTYQIEAVTLPEGYNMEPYQIQINEVGTQNVILPLEAPTATGAVQFFLMDEEANVIANQEIVVLDLDGNFVASGTTNEFGECIIADLPVGSYAAKIYNVSDKYESENGVFTDYFMITQDAINMRPIIFIYAPKPEGNCTIEVEVSDMDTGAWISDEVIQIVDANGTVWGESMLDEFGCAVFTEIPYGTYEFVLAEDSDYYVIGGQTVTVDADRPMALQTIQVKSNTATLVIDTECRNAELVKELSISLYKDGELYGNYTMTNGSVSIAGLKAGSYEVVVNTNLGNYVLDCETTYFISAGVDTVYETLVIREMTGTVVANVKNALTNSYIENAYVVVRNSEGKAVASGMTDTDGNVSFELPLGDYTVHFDPLDAYVAVAEQSVSITADGELKNINFETQPLAGTTVISAQCDNSELVSNLSISLYRNGALYDTYTMTNGVVNISNLPAGQYEIVINTDLGNYKVANTDTTFIIDAENTWANKTLVIEEMKGTVNVTVANTVLGGNIANVNVSVKDDNGDIVATGTTNVNGEISFELPLGNYQVVAEAPNGYAAMDMQSLVIESDGDVKSLVFETRQLVASTLIYVVDEYNNPVEGATIEIVNANGEVVSTSQGPIISLEQLPLGKYIIRTSDYDTNLYNTPVEMEIVLEEEFDYVFYYFFDAIEKEVQTGAVKITLKNEDGTPLVFDGDILVALTNSNGVMTHCQYVLADGTITFSELEVGEYTAEIYIADSPYISSEDSKITFTIEADTTLNADMIVYKGFGDAVVKVSDAISQLGVAGLEIEVFKNGVSTGTFTSDENGNIALNNFEMGIYTYKIKNVPVGYEKPIDGSFEIIRNDTVEVNIKLAAQTGQATLTIVDENGNVLTEMVQLILTDKDGNAYQFSTYNGVVNTSWLKVGEYTVSINSGIDGYSFVSAETVVISADSTNNYNVVFKKDEGSASVKVEVQNLAGNLGIADVVVEIYAENNLFIGSYKTDATGCLTIDTLAPGKYTAKIVPSTLPDGYSALTGTEFVVEKDINTSVVVYALRDVGTLQIRVQDDENTGMANMTVIITDEDGNETTAVTNEYGNITLSELPTGNYKLSLVSGDGYTVSGDMDVTIVSGDVTNSTLTVSRDTGSLKIQCEQPIANVFFEVYDGANLIASGYTDATGAATINKLPTGDYTVKFVSVPTGYKTPADAQISIVKDTETVLPVVLEVQSAGLTVSYTYQKTGYPASGVVLVITDLDGNELGTYTTDETGSVTIDLPAGYYFVRTVTVPAGCVCPDEEFAEVLEGEVASIGFALEADERFGSISLSVVDKDTDTAITGVTISLYDKTGSLYKTLTTNEFGQIFDSEIAVGTYTAIISKNGYVQQTIENIEIADKSSHSQTIYLEKANESSTVQVAVLDEEDVAIVNATVYLRDENDNIIATGKTDENGYVYFENVAYGNYKLSAEADGYIASARINTLVDSEQEMATIKLAKSTKGVVSVAVSDEEFNYLSDIVVVIESADGSFRTELTTNSVGQAILPDLEAGVYTFSVEADGFIAYSQMFTIEANQTNYVDIILERVPVIEVGSATVLVTDETNTPMEGVTVTITNGVYTQTLVTDETGNVVFADLELGEYTVTMSKDGYITKTANFSVQKDANTNITAILEKEITTGSIDVYVKDVDANLLEDVTVVVSDGENTYTLTTDANGNVSFKDLEAGEYTITVSKDGYITKEIHTTVAAKTNTLLNVTLEKEVTTGTVNVTVKDTAGNVLADATVVISDGENEYTLISDASGFVSFENLEAGEYTITISKDGYVASSNTLTVEAKKVYTVNATLEKEITTGGLKVTTQDVEGNILTDVTVTVTNGTETKTLKSDANGLVSFESLEAGEYTVTISKDGYISQTTTVTITAKEISQITAKLEKEVTTGDLKITATDVNGNLLVGAAVDVNGTKYTTDENGEVYLSDLEAGEYHVNISMDGYYAESFVVNVEAKKVSSVEVALEKVITTGDIVVNVTDVDSNILTDATVTIFDGAEYKTLKTNTDGSVIFENLEAGEYTVTISKEGYVAQSTTLTVEAEKIHTINVALEKAITTGDLDISVKDTDGNILADATVIINGVEYKTDENGELYLSDMEAGRYTIQVSKDGYIAQEDTITLEAEDIMTLEFTLEKEITTGGLNVSVKDDEGNVLSGATVVVSDGVNEYTLNTDANGNVSFADLEAGKYTVAVSKDGYVSKNYTVNIVAKEIKTLDVVLDKEITTGSLDITVKDENGNILADALVSINGTEYKTDANGNVYVADLEMGNYTIAVSKDGYIAYTTTATVEAESITTVEIVLEKEITTGDLDILVTDVNGNVLADTLVSINGTEYKTDANGKVYVADLEAGEYTIIVSKDGYITQTYTASLDAKTVLTIEFALEEVITTGDIDILVEDVDGNVLANADIDINGEKYTTDENGKLYVADLEAGTYTITVSKDGYISQTYTANLVAETILTLEFALEKEVTTGSLSVLVTDNDGNPLTNANVEIDGQQYTTNAEGYVTIDDLEAGEYTAVVSKDGYISATIQVIVTAETNNEVSVKLDKIITTGSIAVTVLDHLGNVVANATVTLYNPDNSTYGTYVTDAEGKVYIDEVEAGNYKIGAVLAITGEDGISCVDNLVVVAGEETTITLTLPEPVVPETKGDAYITVTDNSGNVLENVEVKISNNSGYHTGMTAADGTVTFTDLEEGKYTVVVTMNGYHVYTGTLEIVADEVAELNVALDPITTGNLNVNVVDEDNQALADATVVVSDGVNTHTLNTDANGNVSFADLEAGEYTVTISKDGYVTQTEIVVVNALDTTELNVSMEKVITTGDLDITVKDADGNILVDAIVNIDGTEYKTDANGNVYVADLEMGKHTITVSKDGYITYTTTATVEAEAVTTVDVVLEKVVTTGNLDILVTDIDGNVLANADVDINGTKYTTDENGKLYVADLEAGNYTIIVSKDGYVAQTYTTVLDAETTLTIEFTLEEVVTTGDLNITVKDTDGNLLADAIVDIDGTEYKTDANGNVYIADLEAGHYTIHVFKDGYVDQEYVAILEAGTVLDVEFILDKEITTGDLSVNVFDELGEALNGANIIISDGENEQSFTVDENGNLSINLEAGEYTVRIYKDGYISETYQVIVNAQEMTVLNVTLEKAVTTGGFDILVKDVDGNVLADALVNINGNEYKTDANGKVYVTDLEAGEYTITVSKDGYITKEHVAKLIANTIYTVEFTLEKEVTIGQLYVNVKDDSNNKIANATVIVSDGEKKYTFTTDETGNLYFDLEAGTYTVTVLKDGYETQEYRVTIEAEKTTPLNAVLPKIVTTGELIVLVTDVFGNPLTNAIVEIDGQQYTTDAEGYVIIDSIEAGEYTVNASLDGYIAQSQKVTIEAEDSVSIVFMLETAVKTGDLSVFVSDTSGNMLAGATVVISNGETEQTLTTDANGNVSLSGVAVGNYTITISKDGYISQTHNVSVGENESKTVNAVLEKEVGIGSLEVLVTDESGNALVDAIVNIDGKQYKTDMNGKITIDNLAEGDYRVTVSKDGYIDRNVNVTILADNTVQVTVALTQKITTGDLEVIVKDVDGKILANAIVYINDIEYKTDANGKLYLSDMEAGTYVIKASMDGYISQEKLIVLEAETVYTVEFALEKEVTTGSLNINVKDTEGNLLAGAIVTVSDGTNEQTFVVDPDGKVSIPDLEAGEYSVKIACSGYVSKTYTVQVNANEIAVLNAVLDKAVTTGNLDIIVKDNDGNVITNAIVRIDGTNYQVDENGRLLLEYLEAGEYNILVMADGYISASYTVVVNAKETTTLNATLEKAATTGFVSIGVQTQSGTKINGATVIIESEDGSYRDVFTTDELSHSKLRELEAGTYKLTVICEGYENWAGTFTVKAEQTTIVNVPLTPVPAKAKAEFVVTDRDGNVLAGATIVVTNKDGFEVVVKTGEDGTVMIPELEQGTYDYSVELDGYLKKIGTFTTGDTLITLVSVVLEKEPVVGDVIVSVVDKDGNALEGATITIENETFITTTETDADGLALLESLIVGEYTITATLTGYHPVSMKVTVTELGTNVEFVLEEVALPVEEGDAIITVKDQDGNPLANTEVTIENKDRTYSEKFVTDANGKLSVKLPVGVYDVVAKRDGYISDGARIEVTTDKVAETTLVLDEIIEIVYTSAEIKILNQNGDKVENATVVVYANGKKIYEGVLVNKNTLYLSDLEPGHYTVMVSKANHESKTVEFNVAANENAVVEVVLIEKIEDVDAGAFEITVTDKDGDRLKNALVTILKADDSVFGSFTTNNDGTIFVTALPSGEYTLYASYKGVESDKVTGVIVDNQITKIKLMINEADGPGDDDENVQTGDSVGKFFWLAILSAIGAIFTRKKHKK